MKQIQAPKTFTRGLAFGPVFLLQKQAFVPSEEPSQGVAEEQARYDEALGKVATDLMLLAEDNPSSWDTSRSRRTRCYRTR